MSGQSGPMIDSEMNIFKAIVGPSKLRLSVSEAGKASGLTRLGRQG
jgi:hypothetical protein